VAGATGVLGKASVPALRSSGHEVVGLARTVPAGRDDVVAVDILDRDAVIGFAADWRPEAIVHLATAIPADLNPRRIAVEFAPTNRLRTTGTANLAAAAEESGARLISQSICFVYAPGPGLADEAEPLWDSPLMDAVVPSVTELENRTLGTDGGAVLRFGHLYGPGTAFEPDGGLGAAAAQRKLPILRSRRGESTFSFIHAGDAGTAVAAVIDRGATGVFNIADDEPATVSEWLPALAAARGGKRPRSLPSWVARPLVGAYGIAFMTGLRGASNARAKAELGWAPAIASWREGFSLPSSAPGD
jgi:nucleoside-diphosphate-sugar epimerase